MFLITELTEDVKYTVEETVSESTGEKKKNLFIEGIFMQAGVVNRNKRLYPTEVLANEAARYNENYILKGRGYGELGHPDGPKINLERVSHMMVELRQDGNNFFGKARITDTPYGNIARGLMESGARLGVSSRGLGSLKVNPQGITEVQGDFRLAAAADIVADPSAPDAWVNGIMEGVQFVRDENSEVYKRVDKLKEEMAAMTVKKLEEERIQLFQKFLKSISEEIDHNDHPKMTPHEAHQKLRANGGKSFHDGHHKYYLDGPQGSPGHLHAPFVSMKHKNYFVQGEPGDKITKSSRWGMMHYKTGALHMQDKNGKYVPDKK